MSINLDLKDKKLIYELDNNSRQSCSQIGKKIGLSPEVVNYRIKRLENEGIITQYQMIVNLTRLGILQFKICLSLQHIDSEKLEKILSELQKMKEVKWMISCNGNWDLILSLETDSIEHIDELKSKIISKFGTHIDKKAISILVEARTYNRNYFLDKNHQKHEARAIMKKEKEVKIDELDLKILKSLAENARKPIIDIAGELSQSARVINYRIKQMEKKGLILGYKVALDYEKLGLKFFKTFIYLDNIKQEKVQSLINFFENHPNIIHHVKVLGNWDLEPEFEVHSESEFNEIIKKIKDDYSDIIKNIDIITISKEHKFVYF